LSRRPDRPRPLQERLTSRGCPVLRCGKESPSSSFSLQGSALTRLVQTSLRRFAELENEIVGFADGRIFGSVLIAEPKGRGQGPNALRPVGRVLRVRVDLGGAYEFEARLLGKRDRIVLANIAVYRFRVLRGVPLAAMVLEAEHPAGLQRAIEGGER